MLSVLPAVACILGVAVHEGQCFNNSFLFPNARVLYWLGSRARNSSRFLRELKVAISILNKYSCVNFVRDYEDSGYVRHLRILGEYSWKFNEFDEAVYGDQEVYITFNTDTRYDIMRKLMRAIAPLHYEHHRSDRDKHLYINWPTIEEGKKKYFDRYCDYPPDIPGFPKYTHGCLISGGLYYYSRNGSMTMEPKSGYESYDGVAGWDYERMYDYVRWPVDIVRLNMIYAQLGGWAGERCANARFEEFWPDKPREDLGK